MRLPVYHPVAVDLCGMSDTKQLASATAPDTLNETDDHSTAGWPYHQPGTDLDRWHKRAPSGSLLP